MVDEKDSGESTEKEVIPEECNGKPEGCNGGDEFITVPCPVHGFPGVDKPPTDFGEDVVVITDADLNIEKPYGRYYGHLFICPKCKEPSIMVNENMGEFCVKCGLRVLVKSRVVTERIRSLEKKDL